MQITVLIVGQGLAGTALAWQLRWRGVKFLIVDRDDPVTASKIAAGLITPITGKRFALEDSFDADFAVAEAFYRRVETETKAKFFRPYGAVRILREEVERKRFEMKRGIERHIASATLSLDHPHGCFAMPTAARLDVPEYLKASRSVFERDGCFRVGSFTEDANVVIDCTGIAALREGRLAAELFQPAKGEILTLRIPGLVENRVIHHGVWLARIGGDLYRAGATYTWDVLDDVPTSEGRNELVRRVKEFLKLPFEVAAHDAATRPIALDRQPIVRQIGPRRWAFNGLGSKGALLAPRLARDLADKVIRDSL